MRVPEVWRLAIFLEINHFFSSKHHHLKLHNKLKNCLKTTAEEKKQARGCGNGGEWCEFATCEFCNTRAEVIKGNHRHSNLFGVFFSFFFSPHAHRNTQQQCSDRKRVYCNSHAVDSMRICTVGRWKTVRACVALFVHRTKFHFSSNANGAKRFSMGN